jgi:L-lactate dehydrogenase complex protein LldG
VSSAREEILGRVRAALGDDRPSIALPDLGAAGDPTGLVARFAERVADYRATVTVVKSRGAVHEAVAEACSRAGVVRLGVPDGIDRDWVPDTAVAIDVRAGSRADALAFDGLDGLLAQAPLGIAETGTIVFDGGPGQGPRAASLLPDALICVIDAESLGGGVAAATTWMRSAVVDSGRPLTMVSGPSATSDIELDRVEGVHGPRTLEVIVIDASAESAS